MISFALHKTLEADSIFVRDLSLSHLRLHNIKTVPWLILVPRREGAREIHALEPGDREGLMQEITLTSRAIETIYAPTKINVAALGNVVSQLHVHVIGRFESDPAWPKPVWGNLPPAPYTEAERTTALQKLNGFFDGHG